MYILFFMVLAYCLLIVQIVQNPQREPFKYSPGYDPDYTTTFYDENGGFVGTLCGQGSMDYDGLPYDECVKKKQGDEWVIVKDTRGRRADLIKRFSSFSP